MLEPAQPQVMPPFEFHQFIRRLGGNFTTMFRALQEVDSHIPPEPIIVHSERAGEGVG